MMNDMNVGSQMYHLARSCGMPKHMSEPYLI